LMVERVYGELATQSSEAADWKESLRSIAHEYWELYERHPWLLEVPITRPVVGHNRMDRQEHELGAVDGVGLDELEMDAAVALVVNHVASAARRLHGIRRDAEASGMSDDERWHDVLPLLNRVLAGRYYPVSEREGEAIGAADLETGSLLDFALGRIRVGIETWLEARRSLPKPCPRVGDCRRCPLFYGGRHAVLLGRPRSPSRPGHRPWSTGVPPRLFAVGGVPGP